MLSTMGTLCHATYELGWESSPFEGALFLESGFFDHTCPISCFQGLVFDLPQTFKKQFSIGEILSSASFQKEE